MRRKDIGVNRFEPSGYQPWVIRKGSCTRRYASVSICTCQNYAGWAELGCSARKIGPSRASLWDSHYRREGRRHEIRLRRIEL